MAYDKEFLAQCSKRILKARMSLLANHGFYGLLLSHMIFAIDEKCETAATDGERIYFSPDFMQDLSDKELEFVLMHEVMHVALLHCQRTEDRHNLTFNIATDIVVNSNIMHSLGDDPKKITLSKYGEAMHIAPDGKEGYLYTAEEVYEMLNQKLKSSGIDPSSLGNGSQAGNGGNDSDSGQACQNKKDAYGNKQGSGSGKKPSKEQGSGVSGTFMDDHSKWGSLPEDKANELRDAWAKRLDDASKIVSILDPSNQCGSVPLCAERLLKDIKKAQTDWRTILNEFVQEEICDYSFSPPDRRFSDTDFFLPDYNETDATEVKNILFMVDTSASMSDDMIAVAYNEIRGAIDQFGGKLEGWLGFFDARIVEPLPFSSIGELEVIRPYGGGGTRFDIIFQYVKEKMINEPPACIVILTDGYCSFPDEAMANEIPVLWIINNDEVNPPWGKVTRIDPNIEKM
ncbi:MAG: hypothetical protein IJ039_07595 [Clostridia bacterium]|nr:hypothetical protein [Clostridia bacterium]